MDLKNAHIAEIVRFGEVVINKGFIHGVENNMLFLCFQNGKDIYDTQTNQNIGKLEVPIALFRVINVQEHISYLVLEEIPSLFAHAERVDYRKVWMRIKQGYAVKAVNAHVVMKCKEFREDKL